MIEKWKGFLNKGNNIVPFFMDHSKAFQTQVTPYYWLSWALMVSITDPSKL